jgi:hypothetical protein
MPTFDDSVVNAVLTHMNTDHPEDNLLIVQAFGPADATAARMTGLDGNGGCWAFQTPAFEGEREQALVVPWSAPISERAEIRREVVVLYERACSILGLPSRNH